jgi:hypothetical protein
MVGDVLTDESCWRPAECQEKTRARRRKGQGQDKVEEEGR